MAAAVAAGVLSDLDGNFHIKKRTKNVAEGYCRWGKKNVFA